MHTLEALAEARGEDPAALEDRIEANAAALLLPAVSARPKRELGQHLLVDENILHVVGRLAELDPEDVVLEVGPGLGVLTAYLADRVSEVHAIELDRSLEPLCGSGSEGGTTSRSSSGMRSTCRSRDWLRLRASSWRTCPTTWRRPRDGEPGRRSRPSSAGA